MRIPAKAIPRFAGLKQRISGDADNKELRQAILDALPEAVEQTKELAPYFRTTSERETAKKIFDFLKSRVKYQADDYRQVIQLPSAILRPGAIADCKSLSLFTAAILQNLGIPWHFVLASYSDSTIPGHIYVQTDSGVIIDVVWGKFDSEKKPRYRYVMRNRPTIKKDMYSNKIGLGATESGAEWAIRNGVWYSYSPAERLKINAKKIMPLQAIGRGVVLTAIAANAGGLASMLKQLDIESNGVDKAKFKQSSFDKKRDIELKWLEAGGNPNELYDAFNKGYTKLPKGKKFAELLQKAASGQRPGPGAWIAGILSAVFGKRYEGETIGEPVATTTAAAASSSVWIPIVQQMAAAIGAAITTAIVAKVAPAPNEPTDAQIQQITETQAGPTAGANKTLLIIGGLAAAGALIYFVTRKKK
jgi:hypothetical protein